MIPANHQMLRTVAVVGAMLVALTLAYVEWAEPQSVDLVARAPTRWWP